MAARILKLCVCKFILCEVVVLHVLTFTVFILYKGFYLDLSQYWRFFDPMQFDKNGPRFFEGGKVVMLLGRMFTRGDTYFGLLNCDRRALFISNYAAINPPS